MQIVLGIMNFQIIKQARLVFKPGITMIVGPNGSGKTAILRALYALVKNPRFGKYYVKAGAKKTAVAFQLDQQTPIMWIKSKKETIYQIGDQVYDKAGTTKLNDIVSGFPFILDPLKDSKRVLNFYTEWDHPFPLDRTPGDIFKLFEDMFQIAESAKILRTIDEDKSGLKAKRIQLEDNQISKEKSIKAIEDYFEQVDAKKAVHFKKQVREVSSRIFEMQVDMERADQDAIAIRIHSKVKRKDIDISPVSSIIHMKADLSRAELLSKVLRKKKVSRQKIDLSVVGKSLEMREDFQRAVELDHKIQATQQLKVEVVDTDILSTFLKMRADFLLACSLKKDGKDLKDGILKGLKSRIKEIEKLNASIPACPYCKRPF